VDSCESCLDKPGDSGIGVARIALQYRGNMVLWHSLSDRVIVTAITLPYDFLMIDIHHRQPACAVVASLTRRGAGDVLRVFAAGMQVVMALLAIVVNTDMIKERRHPTGANAVAGLAVLANRYVVDMFATCKNTIVTAQAVCLDTRVVHTCRGIKPSRLMAAVTFLFGRYMIG